MVIKIENLEKKFKSKVKHEGFKETLKNLIRPEYKLIHAVNNLNLSIKKGEMLAFIGPNGAGKSTTIKLITGILYPDSGNIEVMGMNPHKQRKQLAYKIGTVFGQKSQLWYHLPAADSLSLLGSIYNMSPAETKKQVDFLTDIFEIHDYINQPVRKLSLGQRIRCEIAASMMHNPEILFLDEPSIGLDVVVKQKIRDLIKRVNKEKKVTVFLTSHDAGDIEKICKRVIIINKGMMIWDGLVKKMKYSLLNKKIIDVKLENKLKLKLKGVDILKNKDYSAKLEIDINKIKLDRVINELIKNNSIQDINISSTPMEEVISMIYEGAI